MAEHEYKNFQYLNAPAEFKEYYTQYPHGYTIWESFMDMLQRVNDLSDNMNDINVLIQNFISTFETDLQGEVSRILNTWKEDGTLEILINEALSNEIQSLKDRTAGVVSVLEYGAVGDGVTDDTFAIQSAINYARENKLNCILPKARYKVTEIHIINYALEELLEVDFDGSTIVPSTTTPPILIQGRRIYAHDFKIESFSGSTHDLTLGWLWLSKVDNIRCGNILITPTAYDYGVFWNVFNHWDCARITFKADIYAINHNLWTSGRCFGITVENVILDFYNNVFDTYDFLGSVNVGTNSRYQPLILRNCNYEGQFNNTGLIQREGGYNSTVSNARFFDMDPTTDHVADGGYGQFGYRYENNQATNIFWGGDASVYNNEMLTTQGMSASIETSADDITGNSKRYLFTAASGQDFPYVQINFPPRFLKQAKQLGFISLDFWIKATSGLSAIFYNTGAGDIYSASLPPFGSWQHISLNIPIPSGATTAYVRFQFVGAGVVKDMTMDAISLYVGKTAHPFAPSPYDTRIQEHRFAKNCQTNTTTTLFSFDVAGGEYGSFEITLYGNNGAYGTGGFVKGVLGYGRRLFTASPSVILTGLGSLFTATPGGIASISTSVSGSVVTVSAALTDYPPNHAVTVQVIAKPLENNKTITQL